MSRLLQHFRIKYVDYSINISTVKEFVAKEMEGPGRLLGYRTLHKKIRDMYGLNVPSAIEAAAVGLNDDDFEVNFKDDIIDDLEPFRSRCCFIGDFLLELFLRPLTLCCQGI